MNNNQEEIYDDILFAKSGGNELVNNKIIFKGVFMIMTDVI